jgi:hypothetical protein
MSSEPKFNAEQICNVARHMIRQFLNYRESCELSRDESEAYFVFRFTRLPSRFGINETKETGRFTVLGAMIEDGIMSERQLNAALWHTLGQIRGMV